ncbi:MAG: hypothetical protein GY899_05575 [Verrucomicrobiaceae bacterium]|nr:hypothetical protein [Verrucomicrobiaceae bacterium]
MPLNIKGSTAPALFLGLCFSCAVLLPVTAWSARVADTKFSVNRGFFDSPFVLEISTRTKGASIRFTTDGSEPSLVNGQDYHSPLIVSATTVLRAAAFKEGLEPTDVDTQTYLFLHQVIRQTGVGLPWDWGELGNFDTSPGNLPAGPYAADYAMDPDIVDDPLYASTIENDMRSIPSLLLSLHPEDLFSSQPVATNGDGEVTQARGIYPIGKGFERACSAELILPDGATGFQINCSVEVQGATSTDRWKTDKLSMRLKFKAPYGPSELDFPLFGDDATDSINTVILDATNQQAWTHPVAEQQLRAQYVRDQFVGDLQNAAGGIAPHGSYAHVYLNGFYWGVYCLHEFVEESFAAAYRGGDKSSYDIIRHRSDNVVAGSADAFLALLDAVENDLAIDVNYRAVAERLDVVAFIDYMVINFYAGNADWAFQNWNASFHRSDPRRKWLFHNWDAEKTFQSVDEDVTDADDPGAPTHIHQRLLLNAEYRLAFADRARVLLANGGILTPEVAASMYSERLEQINRAIVAESARWGDNRNPDMAPYTRETWLAESQRLENDFFPERTAVVLAQLVADGLYPVIPAPEFSQHGGEVPGGFVLDIAGLDPGGAVYYSVDGVDPRQPGGGIAEDAITGQRVIVNENMRIKARVRQTASGEWSALTEAVFFIQGAFADLRVSEIMYNPGNVSEDEMVAGFDDADDFEFIELHNTGATPIPLAGVTFNEGLRFTFGDYTLDGGEHILVVNDLPAFRERYGVLEVVIAGEFGGSISNSGEGIALTGPFGSLIQAFSFDDDWFPPTDGGGQSLVSNFNGSDPGDWNIPSVWRASTFPGGSPGMPDSSPPALRITELNFHPGYPRPSEVLAGFKGDDDFEYVEVRNTGPDPLALQDFSFSGAFDFTFGPLLLGSGEYAVVVANINAFAHRYGEGIVVAGSFAPRALNNSGEDIILKGPAGEVIHHFRYSDGWASAADGIGASLVVTDEAAELFRWQEGEQWSASSRWGGSPGAADPVANPSPLRVSEVMFNPGDADADEIAAGFDNNDDFEFIELVNTGETPLDISGYVLAGGIDMVLGSYLLAPGEEVVVVKDEEAFMRRYANATTVIGEYEGNLKNDSEEILLLDPSGATVIAFTYDDAWHESTDGGGHSLTIIDENYHPVYWGNEEGWRPSGQPGGSPGLAADPYFAWVWSNFPHVIVMDPAVSGSGIDADGDGSSNLIEYVLGTDPLSALDRGYFQSVIEVDGDLFLTLTYQVAAEDALLEVQFSTDLVNWTPSDLASQLYISGVTPDGVSELTVMDSVALDASPHERFVRLKIVR